MAALMSTGTDFKKQLQFPIKHIVIHIVIHIKYRDTYRLWKKCIVTPLVSDQMTDTRIFFKNSETCLVSFLVLQSPDGPYMHRGLLRFLLSLNYSKKNTREESQIFIQHFFKIVLYWCLDLIHHNIGTHLKLNKYIFDISIPFCHHLYLSATLKQCFTEFAVCRTTFHHVDMSV